MTTERIPYEPPGDDEPPTDLERAFARWVAAAILARLRDKAVAASEQAGDDLQRRESRDQGGDAA